MDVIHSNLKNLDYVSHKIVYLKSHAINMMLKDTIVLKKESLDERTVIRGMNNLKSLMENALTKIICEGTFEKISNE